MPHSLIDDGRLDDWHRVWKGQGWPQERRAGRIDDGEVELGS
jgi:hypothetical protein